ncbi:Protein of uncharacterised function DUF72 [Bordetella pertussis]|nr:Protein of uncharacterised function DUF72 [Bordetella pertussis]
MPADSSWPRKCATPAGSTDRAAASSSRFQYEYSPQELAELAERVRRLAERARQTHAVFNTNYEDQGMRNAAGLAAALAP